MHTHEESLPWKATNEMLRFFLITQAPFHIGSCNIAPFTGWERSIFGMRVILGSLRDLATFLRSTYKEHQEDLASVDTPKYFKTRSNALPNL